MRWSAADSCAGGDVMIEVLVIVDVDNTDDTVDDDDSYCSCFNIVDCCERRERESIPKMFSVVCFNAVYIASTQIDARIAVQSKQKRREGKRMNQLGGLFLAANS